MNVARKPKRVVLMTAGGPRPLTDLEKCMLLILKTKNGSTSREVLALARRFKICAACSDRSEVFYVGEKLLKKKLLVRSFRNKQFCWRLTRKGERIAQSL